MFSLNEDLIARLNSEAVPSYQATCAPTDNLGFGFLFYSFTRVLRPQHTVVIGSKAGFSVINFALGVKDNEGHTINEVECYATSLQYPKQKGMVHFIDPGYDIHANDENHWYGIGFWSEKEKVEKLWKSYGVEQYVRHHKMRSQDFVAADACPKKIDLLYIDGDHSYDGVTHDFMAFYNQLSDTGVILAHDVDPRLKEMDPNSGGYEALQNLPRDKFEVFRLPILPGLAIVRKKIERT